MSLFMVDAFDPPAFQGQAGFEMANLRPKTTGLPFIVFISQKDGAQHDVRVKVSPSARVRVANMSTYALRPFRHEGGPPLTGSEEKRLQQWSELNLKVLVDYWNAEIPFTEDAIEQLLPV